MGFFCARTVADVVPAQCADEMQRVRRHVRAPLRGKCLEIERIRCASGIVRAARVRVAARYVGSVFAHAALKCFTRNFQIPFAWLSVSFQIPFKRRAQQSARLAVSRKKVGGSMSRLSSDRARMRQQLRARAERVNDASQVWARCFSNQASALAAAFSLASALSVRTGALAFEICSMRVPVFAH